MAKRKKIERFFARLLDYKRSYLHLRRRRKEISDISLNKRSKIALKRTILRDLVPNCGPLAGVGLRIPLISPSLRPWVGDQIEVHVHTRGGEHLAGYSSGVNMRTEQRGYYPTFKVQHFVDEVRTPTYQEAAAATDNTR